MSTKTIKQRIAVVAVSALTAGVISVVSAPAANSATADATASSLWIATLNSSTTDAVVTAAGGDTSLDRSKGFLAVTSANAGGAQVVQVNGTGLLGGTTGTAAALQSSKLVFNAAGGAITDRVSLVATNGIISGVTSARILLGEIQTINAGDIVEVTTAAAHGLAVGDIITVDAQNNKADATAVAVTVVTSATVFRYVGTAALDADVAKTADNGFFTVALTYNGNATSVVRSNGQNPVIAGIVTPNAGATSMTVSAYKGGSVSSTLPTNGTLLGSWVITLPSTDVSGIFSAADSPVAITQTATTAAITTSVDASTSGILAGNPLFIQVIGKNAYSLALTSGTYVASATNGATVAWGNAAAATAAGTLSTATVTPDGTDQLRIDPASSLTTTTTTVTITHNGAPVTTKTLTFYGEAKKIVIESVKSGRNGTTVANSDATAYAVYSYRDSADGKVPGSAATFNALSSTAIVTTGASVRSPSRSTQATLAGTNSALADATETLIGTGSDGIFAFSCGSTSGTSTVNITTTSAISLATVTAPVTIACNGGLGTYTVSTDKASYAVGEIATITIDAKDTSGNPVSDNTVIAAGSVSVGGGSLTATIAGTEVFTAGKRTLQAQMTTAGKFNTVVTLAGAVTTTATTGYAVTDGAVSNAEVLKSIVALIASINKQIAALQKLILKR